MSEVRVLAGELIRGTPKSAGFDLLSRVSITLMSGQSARIPVSLITEMDEGVVGLVLDKSGLAGNKRITRRAGVIDGDYPDEWEVVLVNEGTIPFPIEQGQAIAQVVFVRFILPDKYKLKSGERVGGFGSTD